MGLKERVFEAGVVGAGGAGFPTHVKLAAAARLLLVNAAECEPLLASDRYVMRHHADEVVAGIAAAAAAVGAGRVIVGTKRKYAREIAALRSAIAAAGADVEIAEVASFYPAGDEQVLIYETLGETVPAGGIPLDLGIVVINVTTALGIARAAQGIPVTRHDVTVTGEVARPVIVDAPIGATAAQLIAAAGGATQASYAIVRGGPMMGRHHPMSQAGGLGFGKADGGLVVLPAGHPLIALAAQPIEHILNQAKSACVQCQLCTDMCPRYLIGHTMRPHRVMRSLAGEDWPGDVLDPLACCECGICELFACPMGLSPRRVNAHLKGLLRGQGAKIGDAQVHPEQTRERGYRRVGQSRLIERWALGAYPTELDDLVDCQPGHVIIPTRHGVGRAATPTVEVGDAVRAGQVIAAVEPDQLGALVHASIDGTVAQAGPGAITIERTGRSVTA
jgi:Na+-translocating ferredoxin:NAD+ oxidoreductase RnfC subunit